MSSIGRPQSDILQKTDENTELISSMLPSLMSCTDVDALNVHDKLVSTSSISTLRYFLTYIECEQMRRFLQQVDFYEFKLR